MNFFQKLNEKQPKIIKHLHHQKISFFLSKYKICQISKEAYKKCEIEIIDKEKYFRINRRDLEIESDYKNWAQILDNCDL